MQFWSLVVDTFRESRDTKLLWVLLIISTIVAMFPLSVGFDNDGYRLLWYHFSDPEMRMGTPGMEGFYGRLVSDLLIGLYIGWFGVGMSLIATAGIFPAIIRPGAIEVLVSKPLSRWKIFFGKYVGSLSFVLIQGSYFVLLLFLVIGLGSNLWIWGCFWCIPLLVIVFSYLYAVCVWVSLRTGSGMTGLLITLAFWFMCWGVQTGYEVVCTPPLNEKVPLLKNYGVLVHGIVPKTKDIPIIAAKLTHAGSAFDMLKVFRMEGLVQLTPEQRAEAIRTERESEKISVLYSLSTSLGFEAVVLLLAAWTFQRRDF